MIICINWTLPPERGGSSIDEVPGKKVGPHCGARGAGTSVVDRRGVRTGLIRIIAIETPTNPGVPVMVKRIRSVWIALVMLAAFPWMTHGAEAAGASASRSCLTGAARNLLSRIERQFGTMQVVSTCRPGARIAGTGRISRHASGNAVDFNAGGRKGAVIRWLIANHHSGGTMTYAHSGHVHVDIGHRFVSLAGSRRYASRSSRYSNRYAARSGRYSGRMALGGPSSRRYEGRSASRSDGTRFFNSH